MLKHNKKNNKKKPKITITKKTRNRLKKKIKYIGDTHDSILNQLLDQYYEYEQKKNAGKGQ